MIIAKLTQFKINWKTLEFSLAEDCGANRGKVGVSLTKSPPKGYRASLAIGLETDGQDHKMRERGKQSGAAAGVGEERGGAPWPAGQSSPELSVRALRCSVYHSESTGGERRARGTCFQPLRGQGGARVTSAMACGDELPGERGQSTRKLHFAREMDGERAGKKGSSPAR